MYFGLEMISYNMGHKTKNITRRLKITISKLIYVICYMLYVQRGYSFLELLIVIALVGTIGVVTSQVFIMGLRSQAKSEILKEVKQNGDYASAVMDNMIRNALDIDDVSCNTNTQQLSIMTKDGVTVTYDCSNPQIASRSGDPVTQLLL